MGDIRKETEKKASGSQRSLEASLQIAFDQLLERDEDDLRKIWPEIFEYSFARLGGKILSEGDRYDIASNVSLDCIEKKIVSDFAKHGKKATKDFRNYVSFTSHKFYLKYHRERTKGKWRDLGTAVPLVGYDGKTADSIAKGEWKIWELQQKNLEAYSVKEIATALKQLNKGERRIVVYGFRGKMTKRAVYKKWFAGKMSQSTFYGFVNKTALRLKTLLE